jgi:hypothetical protein
MQVFKGFQMKSVTTTKSAATTQLAAVLAAVLVGGLAAGTANAVPTQAQISGEIERSGTFACVHSINIYTLFIQR